MKIVRIVSELDFGGVEQVLANSIPQIANQVGVEVSVIVLGKGGRVSQNLINQGVSVHILNQNSKIPNIGLLRKLYKLIKNLKPDVIHCQGGEANFHGILAASWANVPNIIGEEIGIPNHHSYWKLIFKLVYTKATTIIAISKAVKAKIIDLGEVKEEKVKVIYNPIIEHQSTIDRRPSTKNFTFVSTCRLVPIKNLDCLIQVFAELVEENEQREIRLEIVGDGSERVHLQSLINQLNLNQHVTLHGFQKDVYSFLAAADVFVIPSLSEGSSVSLAEAMSIGLPSIITKVGGAPEILGDSNSGFLIDPLNPLDLKTAMQTMLNISSKERKSMSKRAKLEAKRFSVDHYIKSLLNVYEFRF
ncbi:glycosyltransferase [Belliella aquatica]|uniref:Glycosyltransferase n=1 Tax=Belliella aquatica TaxID=1323734 RepID=A0ABQ1LY05_9BACT|nr:glycosyltransferase [Belliella aquatica]MCH7407303.1 glycosyltransferase [Belliella aquatica]GGC31567.1 hypothetical protein GCM10010993_08180 [Belliella aquatica]